MTTATTSTTTSTTPATTPATTTATTSDAATVLDRLYRAWAAGDADAFVACFTPDATSIVPGSVADGRAAIHQRMATRFAGPLAGTRVVDEVLSVRYLGTDTAVLVSRSTVVPAGADAPPADGWVLATWTLHRQDGNWLIAAYHNCAA